MSAARALARSLARTSFRVVVPRISTALSVRSPAPARLAIRARAGFHTTAARAAPAELTNDQYHKVSDVAMLAVFESLDDWAEENEGADADYAVSRCNNFLRRECRRGGSGIRRNC